VLIAFSLCPASLFLPDCPACFEAPKERARVKLLLASQEHVHANLFSNMLQAMRPLMGMENSKLANSGVAVAADDGDDDEEGSTSVAHNAQLMRALQGIGAGKAGGGAASMNEDDADYAALDTLCKGPGGACAVPAKKANKKAPAAAAAASGADAPTAGAEETKAEPR
jgi:hypothetical protein